VGSAEESERVQSSFFAHNLSDSSADPTPFSHFQSFTALYTILISYSFVGLIPACVCVVLQANRIAVCHLKAIWD